MENSHDQNIDKRYAYPVVVNPPEWEEDEIDLLELWDTIWKRRKLIGAITFGATLLAVIITLFVLPVIYRSQAVLIPASSGSGSGLSSLVSSLPIPINLSGITGSEDKSTLIVSFLKSDNLKLRLIKKYNLLPILYDNLWDEEKQTWDVDDEEDIPTPVLAIQEKKLDDIYEVSQDKKTGLITISWESKDPKFAALMLQRVIDELTHYLNEEYETDAKRERLFVEKQLAKAKKELEYWEKQIPTKKLTLAEITRERLAAQTVYTELRKQYELAKIAEAKEVINFKVLDPPYIPEKKYKPKRTLICAVTIVTSLFLSIFLVFFLEFLSNARLRKFENAQ
ncbi:hypothetical protein JCM13304A_16570 [Desulfothermus okinawensis JCM 13304]